MRIPVNAPTSGLVSRTATDDWEQALVTGNGRQGVLCYGGPAAVRFTFSHERLFLPLHPPLPAPATAAIRPELTRLLLAGEYAQAAQRVCDLAAAEHPGYRELRWIDPLIGAATLTFTPDPNPEALDPEAPDRAAPDAPAPVGTGYRRSTDFRSGRVSQRWRRGDGTIEVSAFVSRPADVVVVRLRAEATTLDGWLRLGPIAGEPPRPVETVVAADPGWLTLRAGFPGAWPGAIAGHVVSVRLGAGAELTTVEGDGLRVRGATELVLLARTTVAGPGEVVERVADRARATLASVPNDPDRLDAEHRVAHAELFDRVQLRLTRADRPRDRAGQRDIADLRDTEDLLAAPAGPELVERLFDAGRYAVICGSGELPPTLQGVWSGTYDPAWCSGFTVDGNLQAAVAALLPARTPELLLPLFNLIDSIAGDLRENAERLYGCRGFLFPAHISTHGRHNHFGPVWCLTFWTAGAAWLGRLYLDYWRYTGDRAFLSERALPFLREAARFYCDFTHAEVAEGRPALFAPSLSPENHPGNTGSLAAVNATMDITAVAELLRGLLSATAELGLADPEEPAWRRLLAALPPLRVADGGELAEWAWPGLTENHAHRHASHFYPLWYEPDPAVTDDPRLRAAAVEAVRRRLAWWRGNDSDEMAYGLTQIGLAAAALGLADEAYQAVVTLAERYWRPSLVSTHNRDHIFNVDICGGLPALILAMLVRGGAEPPGGGTRLDLLPALPAAWPRGRLAGAAARGQIVVRHLAWAPRRMDAVLVSAVDQRLTVGLPAGARRRTITVTAWAGRPVRLGVDLVPPTR